MEIQWYCIRVNRTGIDDTGLKYSGDSCLITPKGFEEFLGENEAAKTFGILYSELHDYRKNFPFLADQDQFQIV